MRKLGLKMQFQTDNIVDQNDAEITELKKTTIKNLIYYH